MTKETEEAIKKAVDHAERKHGWPKDKFYMLSITTEELGEVAKAMNDLEHGTDTIEHVKSEIMDTIAPLIRMYEAL